MNQVFLTRHFYPNLVMLLTGRVNLLNIDQTNVLKPNQLTINGYVQNV